MASDGSERRIDPRIAVSLVVRVKYSDEQEFIDQFAINISSGGIFIQSRNPHPQGAVVRFEIQLKGGAAILRGKGEVAWSRPPSKPGEKPQVPGMGVKFLELDEPSKSLVKKILKLKTSSAGKQAPAKTSGPQLEKKQVTATGASPFAQPPKQAARPVAKPKTQAPATPAKPSAEPESVDVDLDGLDVEVEAPAPEAQPSIEVDPGLQTQASAEDDEDFQLDISLEDLVQPASAKIPTKPGTARPSGQVHSRVIGIDLGTTYSCAAVVLNGTPHVIPSRKGYRTLPSIVAYDDRGRLLVGHDAKSQMELNPRNTVYGSKRLIGRPYDSPAVSQMKDRFQYEIIPGPQQEAAVRIIGREFSLQQVAAFVLSEIRDNAQAFLREQVNRTVITVPAYYNENQRQAVRQAGMLAGFQVERIVNEPTAAALAYGYNKGLEQRLLVYDLGGGTFDASVLELCGNVYEVISTGGDIFLGGVDFDNQLVDYLLTDFCGHLGKVPRLERVSIQRLRDAAEQAKCALSEKEEAIVRLPFFTTIDGIPKDLEGRVPRTVLEQLVSPLIERSLQVVQQVIGQAHLEAANIDTILLVGGQSRMPLIWRRIRETLGKEPHKGVHPDEAVAIGAALLADSLEQIGSVVLIDVLPMSIGIGAPGGQFAKVLQAGTSLPTSRVCTFKNIEDQQTSMELVLFQGENDRVVNCESLGAVLVSGVTAAPKGTILIEVNFSLDQECLLKVTAREITTSRPLETKMLGKQPDEVVRQKLKISDQERNTEKIGVPQSFKGNQSQGDVDIDIDLEDQQPSESGGFFSKLFGRKKPQ